MEKLKKGKIISRHPYTKEIYHKDCFSKAMKLPMESFPEEFDFVPPTFEPGAGNRKEDERFESYQKRHPKATFIAKP